MGLYLIWALSLIVLLFNIAVGTILYRRKRRLILDVGGAIVFDGRSENEKDFIQFEFHMPIEELANQQFIIVDVHHRA